MYIMYCMYVHMYMYMIVCVCGCTYFENGTRAGTCIAYMIVTKKFSANLIAMYEAVLRPVHNNMTLNNVLCCVVFVSTLVETQHDARIDSDPILTFPCVAFLRLVVKNPPTFLVINLCISRINVTQSLVSLCEPAFRLIVYSCWKKHTYMYMYASIVKSNSFP